MINYIRGKITLKTTLSFDDSLYDASVNGDGLISRVNKSNNVTPLILPNIFAYSCIVQGIGVAWINQGTVLIPVWAVIGTGSGSSGTPSGDELCGGAINASNTAFTIAHLPLSTANFQLFLNGQAQLEGSDYTRSGLSITAASAPVSGVLFANYYY